MDSDKKEEITSKKKTSATVYSEINTVSVDDIRKKAFGTLEDDLEKTLIDKDAIMFTGPSNKMKQKEVKKEEEKEEIEKVKEELFNVYSSKERFDTIRDNVKQGEPEHFSIFLDNRYNVKVYRRIIQYLIVKPYNST